MNEDEKQCSTCRELKPLDTFRPRGNQCKGCIAERNRKYCQANKDYIAKQKHGYRQLNKVRIAKSDRKYQQSNRERRRINRRNYSARLRLLGGTLTVEQWQHALNYFNGCCAVCGRQLNDMFGEFKASADHWIPISYQGDDNPGTVATNIVPLCHGVGGCNNYKNATMPGEWLQCKFGKRKAKKIAARIQTYFDSLAEV